MRLARLALATLFSAALALPALAQTATTTPKTTAPATSTAPKPTTAPATTAASPSGMKNGHYDKCTDSTVVGDADKISINTGTSADLDKLYGIGQARANKIIDNRPYKSTDEVMTKAGIGKAEFADMKCHIKL